MFGKDICDATENMLIDCEKKLRGKSVILYGAGISGNTISKWLVSRGIEILAFVDGNQKKCGKMMNNIPIYSKEYLAQKNADMIVIACGDYLMVLEELKKHGIEKEKTTYIDPKWIRQPAGLKEEILNSVCYLEAAYNLLEDKKSRDVFLNMLKYKISYNINYIESVCSNPQERYFDNELIDMKSVNVYVDAGGYDGDTVIEYAKIKENAYESIFAFEPNEDTYKLLLANTKYLHDIKCYNLGLLDKQRSCTFDISSGLATKIDENGTVQLKCDRLDNIISSKVDLIKMDIEGAEQKALRGAERLVSKYYPILAICVYHRLQDFYEIPLFIHKMWPEYKLYFRQYELSDTETICYAIKRK